MPVISYNPTDNKILARYDFMSAETVSDKMTLQKCALKDWQQLSISQKSIQLRTFANLLQQEKYYFATLITVSMGKPITAAVREVEKCVLAIKYYSDNAEEMLRQVKHQEGYQILQPLGSIMAIMPWNYPLWQVIRVLAPNFILGNGIVLCHAPNVYVVAKAIAKLVEKSDIPSGLLVDILQEHSQTHKLLKSDYIQGLAFTGSDGVGSLLAGYAAGALKPSTVECGGSDPYLVLADADLELAADTIVAMRMNNSGQVCVAAKRIIVVKHIFASFFELVYEKISKMSYADPMLDDTVMGPLARKDIQSQVHAQVQAAIGAGAICHLGGFLPNDAGNYYPPTLLSNVDHNMSVFRQEVFGPVMPLIAADNTEHALALANDSSYGLGAAVFTQDISLADSLAKRLNVGLCAINRGISSDPALPFGGIGRSGYGRELGVLGLTAFANVKVVFN